MAHAGNLKKGEFIRYQNDIWQVQKAEFYSPGKGSALMKAKIKNVNSGKNIDYTFKSNEEVDVVQVESIELQFLYKDEQTLHFMNERDYHQYEIPISIVGEAAEFMKDGEKYFVYLLNDKPLNIRPPMSIRLKVLETEASIKGDTVTGAKKPAKLETGVTVLVPLFVKVGDTVIVNPETGQYVGRE